MPKVLQVNPHAPDQKILSQGAAVLQQGGVVAFPTETFYGLAVDYKNSEALTRLAKLKGRELNKPFPLILSRTEEAFALSDNISEAARELMRHYWPGPLTLVLPAITSLPFPLKSAQGGVGVRVSPHPVAAGLAGILGRAITATSANMAAYPPPKEARRIQPELCRHIELVLDGGSCPGEAPSTVLDLMGPVPVLLRPGAVERQRDWLMYTDSYE